MKVVKIVIPPDKSISHRAIMLSSISDSITRINNLLAGTDCLRTIDAFCAMGVKINILKKHTAVGSVDVCIKGVGLRGLSMPKKPLYLGNSGTTMRILPGILAGQDFEVILTGDKSLSSRPMLRIVEPLRKMGADIKGFYGLQFRVHREKKEISPPLKICGTSLKAIDHRLKIASAQVKSCILLAGLYANGTTTVTEPVKSRDHTERMLKLFNCVLKIKKNKVILKGPVELKSPGIVDVPGDISSASFFIAAGCFLPGRKIIIKDVGLNPTRTGVLDILKKMGADIQVTGNPSTALGTSRSLLDFARGRQVTGYEPVGDIIVKPSMLKGVSISPEEVVQAIDEMPIIMLAACLSEGRTTICGVEELHHKETDRIMSMVTNLKKLGADIVVHGKKKEMIIINGCKRLHGGVVSSFGDHRTAMVMLVAGVISGSNIIVKGLSCINKSFPGFQRTLETLK